MRNLLNIDLGAALRVGLTACAIIAMGTLSACGEGSLAGVAGTFVSSAGGDPAAGWGKAAVDVVEKADKITGEGIHVMAIGAAKYCSTNPAPFGVDVKEQLRAKVNADQAMVDSGWELEPFCKKRAPTAPPTAPPTS